jgi:hypothetical protein
MMHGHNGRAGPSGGPPAGITDGAIPEVPGWLPPALFLLLTLVLFRAFVFSDGMLLGHDTLKGGYAARAFYASQLRNGTFPRWAPHVFGGAPFLEALSGGDALYPTSVLLVLMEPFRALGWKLVLHVLLAGLFMFAWLRALGASRAAALVSGTAYLLAPFMVTLVRSGHDGKLFVTALTPLMFLVTERFWERPSVRRFSAVALVVALVLFTTHFQMAYFLFVAVGAFALFRAVRTGMGSAVDAAPSASTGRRGRVAAGRFVLFLAGAVAGLGASAVQVVPAVEYVVTYSRRTQTTAVDAGESGVEWASSWSLHPEEAMSLVLPEFVGNGSGGAAWAADTYWGRNFLKDNTEYAGVLVLVLAVVSFAGAERRALRCFLAGLGGLALLYALGAHTPVWRIAYALVPGIRLFRTPSMVVFLFGFSAATLAGLGADQTFRAAAKGGDAWRAVRRVLLVTTGLLFALALIASSGALVSFWTSVVYPDVDAVGLGKLTTLAPYIARGAWLAALIGALAAGVAWAVHARRVRPAVLLALFLGLVVADELRVDDAFVQAIDFDRWATPEPTTEAILNREREDRAPYRVLSFVDRAQDVKPAVYGIDLAAGHHPNDLARYRELIRMTEADLPGNLINSPNIERLLNVRYLLWPDYHGQGPPENDVLMRTSVDGRPYMTLHARPGLPRARLVARAVVKPDDAQVAYMLSAAFRPDSEVVLSEPPPVVLDGEPVEGSVTWEERSPNELRMRVTSDRTALLVVADNWFPAWHATVDGRPAPVLRAYHTLRAVPVPAGTHTVRMVYRWSSVVRWSFGASGVVLTLLLGALAWSAVAERSEGRDRTPA